MIITYYSNMKSGKSDDWNGLYNMKVVLFPHTIDDYHI
jgi:hypothetical protein